jgi:hypothetical protein
MPLIQTIEGTRAIIKSVEIREAVTWEMKRRGFNTPGLELELAQKRERLLPHKRKLCLE